MEDNNEFGGKYREQLVVMQKFPTDESQRRIYDPWKESVLKHWDTLSSKYNVVDYETVAQYGEKHNKAGSKECFGELANKFDECMLNKNLFFDNYFLFVKIHDIYVIFTQNILNLIQNDREIYSVEWDVSDRCDINSIFFIRFYIGNKTLKEKKRMMIVQMMMKLVLIGLILN